MTTNGPEIRVSPSRDPKPGIRGGIHMVTDAIKQVAQPGEKLNMTSGHRFREVRSTFEKDTAYLGVHAEGSKCRVEDVPNPDSPDGKWDPYAYMPRFAFDPKEDAFPISPDFDGDTNLDNNAPSKPGGKGNYEDGVIGGKQPLTSGFSVTKKGDYTILTYSFYYATNKATGDYHSNDYSTAEVYLKPGKDGKLEPAYLMTSWHHGAKLTPWSDLKKDPQGKPIVGVDLGTHALNVLDSVPAKGLQVQGDGQAVLNGKPVDQKLSFEAFQQSVAGARYLDPSSPASTPRLRAMTWGSGVNPLLPEVFDAAPPYWKQALAGAKGKAAAGAGAVRDKAVDAVDGALKSATAAASGLWHKATGLFT